MGGMPNVVKTYIETGTFSGTLEIQEQIRLDYEEAQEDLRVNKNLGVYKGALYENFVAEAFVKQGLGLYYYKKENSTLEEDFLSEHKMSLTGKSFHSPVTY